MGKALREVVSHGSKKESTRRKLADKKIRLPNESEFACRTAVIAFGGPNNTHENTYVFRNYDRPDSTKDNEWYFNTGDGSVAKVWKVARATSAAPLYFSKQIIRNSTYLDGSIGCNNPAELMSHQIKGVHGREPDLMLSIGTGIRPRAENNSDEQHKTRKHKLFDNARSVLHAVERLPDIATESEKFHFSLNSTLDSLRKRGKSKYPMYFRFNVPNLGTMELGAWKSSENSKKPDGQQKLRELQDKTLNYLDDESVEKDLEACAKELVRIRRE